MEETSGRTAEATLGRTRIAAIVVAAGSGTRMKSGVKKQFMDFMGMPLVCHALRALENSPVQDIILVTGAEDVPYCETEIVQKYGFKKIAHVTAGGQERWNSVYEGLSRLAEMGYGKDDIVLIQDAARPFLSEELIRKTIRDARIYGACVAAVRAKDTIKIADAAGFADRTPERSRCWQIQTPQTFTFGVIYGAYRQLLMNSADQDGITDDAMVVEKESGRKVRLTEASYLNIKITTPEDLPVGEAIYRYLKEKSAKTEE